jgi:hypothetical protein
MTKCSKCDKCGRIVENEKDITKVSVSYFEKDEALLTFKEVKEDFEFCKSCRDLVLDFLKMHKGGVDNMICECGNRFLVEVSDEKTSVVFCPNCMKVLSWYGEDKE